ncbi:MAG TPA: cytochrome C biogenesis protein, partial [Xanthomonadaceae bacterium]|nr:cytochrome C biogenesis protein [Xanthomonadaceae bacterium]
MSSVFVISAIALVALALAFVLPLLWRDDRRSALALLLVVPLSTAGLYALFGTPDALDPDNRTMPTDIAEAAAQLERRLERDPDRLDGWVLLGRARQELGRRALTAGDGDAATVNFEAAAKAFRAAVELAPDEVDLMVETAEAISFANPELSFSAEAVALLDRALAQNPVHERALWFRGIAALQSGDAATAVQRWETLLPLVDEATATALRTQIARAREQADMPPMDPALAGPADAA